MSLVQTFPTRPNFPWRIFGCFRVFPVQPDDATDPQWRRSFPLTAAALHCTALLPASCAPVPPIQAGWHRHRPRRPDRWILCSNRRARRPRLHPPRQSASGPAAAVTSVITDSYTPLEEETSECAIWRNASMRRGEERRAADGRRQRHPDWPIGGGQTGGGSRSGVIG